MREAWHKYDRIDVLRDIRHMLLLCGMSAVGLIYVSVWAGVTSKAEAIFLGCRGNVSYPIECTKRTMTVAISRNTFVRVTQLKQSEVRVSAL